jgi:hypothetical protein
MVRATQRDEAAIAAWYHRRWPALKRGPQRKGQTSIWVDESGFYLLPAVVRSYQAGYCV